MKLFVGMIMHEFGATGFVDSQEEDFEYKIAEWCKKYDLTLTNPLASNKDVIQDYFDKHKNEILFMDTVEA